jgi:AcrR family transcriptional regulator
MQPDMRPKRLSRLAKRPPRAASRRHPYHHGDLHRALIDAGLWIVENQGVDAVTLRAVARGAKVSHSAPYHHFATRAELLAAIAAAGFQRLVQQIQEQAQASQAQAPLDFLRAVGTGYLTFAVKRPSLFRLMFRPELTRPAQHPLLLEAEAAAFGTLAQAIADCQHQGSLPNTDPRLLAAFAWSTVHGMATLYVDRVFDETPVGELEFEKIGREIIERIIAGMTALLPGNARPKSGKPRV